MPSKPARILVCDDTPSEGVILRTLLTRRNALVDVVHSGEKALAAVENGDYDILLLDVEMPGMSGIEVTGILRERLAGGNTYLPIILLTAQTTVEVRMEGLKAGATDFLTKPFDPSELTARITNHVYAKRLYDRLMIVNRELEEERSKVVKVQRGLLPHQLPSEAGLSFGAVYQPGGMGSGDYYDVIPRGDGRFLLAVGDVSGHGIPSAMHMSVIRATLRSRARHELTIDTILHELNEVLLHALDDYSFVTFQMAEYSARQHRISMVSAGHHPPMMQNVKTGEIFPPRVEPCLPLGVSDEMEPSLQQFSFPPAHRVLFFTDGLTEQPDESENYFGDAGVIEVLKQTTGFDPQTTCEQLVRKLEEFRGNAKWQDDVTLLMMQVD